ncbi:MAG: hypothetical protein JSV54_00195 [Chloroflexota bacterium]|nr:MAG: hypothetical protein JSV54_00195 [Chloroflexota bacterium]
MTYPRQRAYIGIEQEKKISHYSLSPLYRDISRTELAEKIRREVKWPGKPPEVEVLEKKITGYRNTGVWLEDESWSLGESVKPEYAIPADATPILLDLWRYSLDIGYPLTLRHAKWIARLHKVIGTVGDDLGHWQRIQTLFFTALLYADREQVNQALKEDRFNTMAEDGDLAFSPDEVMTLTMLGVLPLPALPKMLRVKGTKGKKKNKEREIERRTKEGLFSVTLTGDFNVAMVVHILHTPHSVDESPELDNDGVFDAFYGRCSEIEDKIGKLSVDQQRAYAILVTCFSKGSKWNDLSLDAFLEIVEKLSQLASGHTKLREILRPVIFDDKGMLAPYFSKVGLTPPLDSFMKANLGLPEEETED